ncbi:Alfin, N-terminal [Dillenia turbinata]|uniref:PHD finger protein ALFIN-LIKE n=1 Tax=Dillenia turbinata TaxID=194707 RepID=A0AAN8VGY4_9MAGN
MDGGGQYNPRTVEEVFRDFKGRRAGMIKALTTDVEEFYQQCDPGEDFRSYCIIEVVLCACSFGFNYALRAVLGPKLVNYRSGDDGGRGNWSRFQSMEKDKDQGHGHGRFVNHIKFASGDGGGFLIFRCASEMQLPVLKDRFQDRVLDFDKKENLCLYGFPSEQWEVNLPAEEVPPELPEPALGINFARDGMQEKDWLSLVAVHSDAWLLAVAFYFGARFGFDKADRKRLFNMINDLPTIFEVVTGTAKKQTKEKSSVSNHGSTKSKSNSKGCKGCSLLPNDLLWHYPDMDDDSGSNLWSLFVMFPWSFFRSSCFHDALSSHVILCIGLSVTLWKKQKGSDSQGKYSKGMQQKDEEEEGMEEEDEEEHGETLCGACGENYASDEFWICCDICERWFHGKCVKITPARAEHIKQYRCPSCSNKRARP